MNMDDFLDMGQVITTKDFLDKIANVQTEKYKRAPLQKIMQR